MGKAKNLLGDGRKSKPKNRSGTGKTYFEVDFAPLAGQADELFGLLTFHQKKRLFLQIAKKAAFSLKAEAKQNRELGRRHKSKTRKALMRSFGVQSMNGRSFGVRVGFRRKGRYIGELAHLIDRGTNPRAYRTKNNKIKYTGKVKPTHFWRDAQEKELPKILPKFREETQAAINQFATRYNNRWKSKK